MKIVGLVFCLSLVLAAQVQTFRMQSVSLQELLAATGGEAVGFERGNIGFDRVEIDSRTVRPGDLFVAVRGERHDGHSFVEQAQQQGATACMVEAAPKIATTGQTRNTTRPLILVKNTTAALADLARWYRGKQEALVIGVTGSVGKTTTREMIHAVLGTHFAGTRSPKNYNNHFGVPLSIFAIEPSHEFAVLELAASRRGEIRELAGIAAPEVGVVTAVGTAHLEGFGSEENILNAKAELVEALPASGFAVLNGDDPRTRSLATRARCPVILAGEGSHNNLRAANVTVRKNRLGFEVDKTRYEVPATGRQHITAALSAIAIGREVGLSPAAIAEGFANFKPAPGRCQVDEIGTITVINDTYNANPTSMQAACRLLSDWIGGTKKLLITGDMLELGPRTAAFHHELGKAAAAAGIDHLLVLGRQAEHVVRGAREAGMESHRLAECGSLESLLAVLDCWLERGAVLLVKGSRGMQMERVVEWLRERERNTLKENMSRVWNRTRACA
jgi:UDP-N-acetylmuramoyl-tripeptide--D-alanyl-D-alanine ligase